MSALEALDPAPTLEIVIPVHNEEVSLPRAIASLTQRLAELPWSSQVTIADNASTDSTALVARRLAHEYPGVRVLSLAEKGRGRALKRAWQTSESAVLAYMDVDLSTDLNALLRSTLRTRFSDAQCGFKALRRDVAEALLPLVEDDTWFFDTELLVLAERAGLRIHEVPVDWVDDPDSRVDIVRTAIDDLRGIRRLGWSLVTGRLPLEEVRAQLGVARAGGRLGAQLALFAMVGVASTLAYALLYLLLRQVAPSQLANLSALLLTAVGNTAANRRFTFGVRGEGLCATTARGCSCSAWGWR